MITPLLSPFYTVYVYDLGVGVESFAARLFIEEFGVIGGPGSLGLNTIRVY